MKIYLVVQDIPYEGTWVDCDGARAFRTKEKAEAYIAQLERGRYSDWTIYEMDLVDE